MHSAKFIFLYNLSIHLWGSNISLIFQSSKKNVDNQNRTILFFWLYPPQKHLQLQVNQNKICSSLICWYILPYKDTTTWDTETSPLSYESLMCLPNRALIFIFKTTKIKPTWLMVATMFMYHKGLKSFQLSNCGKNFCFTK